MRGPDRSPSSQPEQLPSAEELRERESEALLQSIEWTLRHASRHAQRTMPDNEMATFEDQLADYANPCVWLLDCALRLLPDESHDRQHRADTATFAESFLRAFDVRAYSPVCGQCDTVFTVRGRQCTRCGAQRLVVAYEYRSLDNVFVRRWQRY